MVLVSGFDLTYKELTKHLYNEISLHFLSLFFFFSSIKKRIRVDIVASLRFVDLLLRKKRGLKGFFPSLQRKLSYKRARNNKKYFFIFNLFVFTWFNSCFDITKIITA